MNINPKVDELLAKKHNPLDAEIRRVREIILGSDSRVEEAVKWSSPTFMYKGNIASFNMNSKKLVSLMFHKGATIDDPSGLLQGEGKEARTARFYGLEDIESKKGDLELVIRAWIEMKDAE